MDGEQKSQAGEDNHVEAHIDGDVKGKNVIIGNSNVINYYPIIEKNTEKHEPDYWALKHPYPMPPNFTGRVKERATLTHWLKEDAENRLFILRALGGFGKSALSWHWLTHDVDEKEFPKVLWWSFYEGDASFEHFVEETLKYMGCELPQGKRTQVEELLKAMQGQKILLIMDGFERALRAYSSMGAAYQGDEEPKLEDNQLECTDINAGIFLKGVCSLPKMQGKVLMTTRLTPRVAKPRGECLQGCAEKELTAMDKADAVAFFQKQKIKGTHAEIEAACEPYGYHPLSLRILAGFIANHRECPNDIKVAESLDITDDIIQNKNHVLKVAHDALTLGQQKLLSNIACLRSSASYQLLKDISGRPSWKRENKNRMTENLDSSLRVLEARGLLTWDRISNKYTIHPIVQRYAYHHMTAADRTGAHKRMVNYFAVIPQPEKVEKLEDLSPVIELYHHLVMAGNLDEAAKLFHARIVRQVYFQFGAYQICIELLRALFLDGEDKLPRLKRRDYQAFVLGILANAYSLSGQPRRAIPLSEAYIFLSEQANDKTNAAIGFSNLACMTQIYLGALKDSERNQRHHFDLLHELANEFGEAVSHQELGRVMSYRGAWQEAEQELDSAIAIQQKIKHVQTEGVSYAYRALLFLLMKREEVIFNIQKSNIKYRTLSIEYAQRALKLADEDARTDAPTPRDYVRAHWLLGAAYCANNELMQAEEHLFKAINLCWQINSVDHEADILLDIARLRYAQGDFKDAQEKASEALAITERCGYVLQGADVNLFLAQYALEQEKDKARAKQYAEEALKLATCDGPPYYYKVAYEEAERMIERLKA